MSETSSGAVQRAELKQSARRAFKGKKWSGKSYSQLIHAYFQSEQYAKLSPRAVKLLVDLMTQYRGVNNGDLTTAWTIMLRYGWRSKDILSRATAELERRGWIIRTRQGGRHAPTLWALTFYGIDDCRDKEGNPKRDQGIKPDSMPLHLWRLDGFDQPAERSKRRFKNKSVPRLSGKAPPATGSINEDERPKVVPLSPYLPRHSGQS